MQTAIAAGFSAIAQHQQSHCLSSQKSMRHYPASEEVRIQHESRKALQLSLPLTVAQLQSWPHAVKVRRATFTSLTLSSAGSGSSSSPLPTRASRSTVNRAPMRPVLPVSSRSQYRIIRSHSRYSLQLYEGTKDEIVDPITTYIIPATGHCHHLLGPRSEVMPIKTSVCVVANPMR